MLLANVALAILSRAAPQLNVLSVGFPVQIGLGLFAISASLPLIAARPELVSLVAPPALRIGIRRLIEPVLPALPVVSLAELPPHINLHRVANWEMN